MTDPQHSSSNTAAAKTGNCGHIRVFHRGFGDPEYQERPDCLLCERDRLQAALQEARELLSPTRCMSDREWRQRRDKLVAGVPLTVETSKPSQGSDRQAALEKLLLQARRDWHGHPNEWGGLTNAADDEPIFVLKSTDELAPGIVREWARQYKATKQAQGGLTPKQWAKYEEACLLATAMLRWQQERMGQLPENGEGLKP